MLYSGIAKDDNYIIRLINYIDFSKNLPDFVFKEIQADFYFFERELILFHDLMKELSEFNNKVLRAKLIVFFGRPSIESFSYYIFEGGVEDDLDFLKGLFDIKFVDDNNFFPIIITNENFDWLYYEGLQEELGVFGISRNSIFQAEIREFMTENFIPYKELNGRSNIGMDGFVRKININYCDKT